MPSYNESAVRDPLLWLWLSLALPPGAVGAENVLAHFGGDVERVYHAGREELCGIPRLDEKAIEALCNKSMKESEDIFDWCARSNVGVLPFDSPIYPSRLRSILRPPIVLYYRGRWPDIDDNVCIAAVGTRRISDYGRRNAYSFGYDLARAGAIVVSGMARGIDTICHRGALDAGGHTIAVLGCGIDRAYPPENDLLMAEIAAKGTLVSEFKPFSTPDSFHFPIRNRIISGLSLGTVVVEADDRSGAMITARVARDQGRQVFSIPGKVGEQNALGTNILIREGAIPTLCAENILSEYAGVFPHRIFINRIVASKYRPGQTNSNTAGYSMRGGGRTQSPRVDSHAADRLPQLRTTVSEEIPLRASPHRRQQTEPPSLVSVRQSEPRKQSQKQLAAISSLNETQARVYNALPDAGPVVADTLAAKVDLPMNKIMTALTMLELKGLITSGAGGLFSKKYE